MDDNKFESWCEFINNHQKKYIEDYGVPFKTPEPNKKEEDNKHA